MYAFCITSIVLFHSFRERLILSGSLPFLLLPLLSLFPHKCNFFFGVKNNLNKVLGCERCPSSRYECDQDFESQEN
jgi:hypothetical protein